jgi:hypothetical protein
MKGNKWVAVLATGLVLAVAAPVSAQFGGLGSLKKKLETVSKELEKPKSQPPATPAPPQSPPSTPQGGYASSPPAPRPVHVNHPQQANPLPPATEGTPPTNPPVSAKTIRRMGSDYPSNIQITSGRTPTLIQNSLRTITSCTLGYSESEQDTPLIGKNWKTYSFEMSYDPATTSAVFRAFESIKEGQANFSKSTFKEAFGNVDITDDIKNIKIVYIGYDEENYYFRFNLVGDQNTYEINSSVIKEWMESSPLINAKFSNNWELNCDNPENNG